jgi:8-oxo-dGTP diphosphatase
MNRFNVRVYGVLKNIRNEILVTDERIRGKEYTKFPGGGLEFGEGTRDCLKREFLEEMNLRVEVGAHLYTTDYFQISAFNPQHQILSIYYWVHPLEEIKVRLSMRPFHFDDAQLQQYEKHNECESFRFIPFDELTTDSVSLPIDKIVVQLLKNGAT